MWFLLASAALADSTRVLETDAEAAAWIRATRDGMRTRLPVVAPASANRLDLGDADVVRVVVDPSEDPDQAALDARMELGAPCALELAPLDAGWVGWMHGHCGLMFLGSWRVDGDGVVDDRGRPVTIPQFAADAGDTEILRTYARLERTRGRGIWMGMLGTGLLYGSGLGLAGVSANEDRTGWLVMGGVGGALTVAGVGQLTWAMADKRSHPRRLDAFWGPDEIKQRVVEHNHRTRIVWTASPREIGVMGTF